VSERTIHVFAYLPGQTEAIAAGVFTHAEEGVGEFVYDNTYTHHPDALPVDPVDLSLGGRPLPTELHGGFYGAFRDAAPDFWGRLVAARSLQRHPGELDDVDLLLQGGAARIGNLDFRATRDAPERVDSLPALSDLVDVVAAADALQTGLPVDDAWLQLLRQGTSIGGARPKCIVVDGDTQWLAKFPAKNDTFNNARVEHASLILGRLAGIETAQSRVLSLPDGRDGLLVKRFDRHAIAGGFARTAFASALTFLHMDEQDRGGWSYITLAERLRKQPIASGLLEQLYRRMVYNLACRNTDDHPRNHGFLIESRQSLRLAPAYDIVPSPATPGISTDFSLAMTLGAQGRVATVENVLSRSTSFGISESRAREICAEVGEIAQSWKSVFKQQDVSSNDQTMFAASFDRAKQLAGA
jgi:serine/threonine-protein kinase HipA